MKNPKLINDTVITSSWIQVDTKLPDFAKTRVDETKQNVDLLQRPISVEWVSHHKLPIFFVGGPVGRLVFPGQNSDSNILYATCCARRFAWLVLFARHSLDIVSIGHLGRMARCDVETQYDWHTGKIFVCAVSIRDP